MTTTLTQSENKVTLVGVLAQNNLKQGKTKDGREYINGNIVVKTGSDEEHYVQFFEMAKFKSGQENSAYKGLQTVMKTKVSIADIAEKGLDVKPSVVRVSGGVMEVNDYYNKETKQVVTRQQVTGRFIGDAKPDSQGNQPQPVAQFNGEGIVNKVVYQEEQEKATIEILVVGYGGRVEPLTYTVYGKGAEYISTLDKGEAIMFNGVLRNLFKEEQIVTEMTEGFGEPTIETKRTAVREWEIRGAQPMKAVNNYDEVDLVRQALAQREVHLASVKEDGEKRSSNSTGNAPAKKDDNFNFGEALNTVSEEVDMDGLFG